MSGDGPDLITWYKRRVKVLEDLLSCYRIGRAPSEAIRVELARTREHVGPRGEWLGL